MGGLSTALGKFITIRLITYLGLLLLLYYSDPILTGECPSWSQNQFGTARRTLIYNNCGLKSPFRFRSSDSPSQSPPDLNLKGFLDTKMSGSSQFCPGERSRALIQFLRAREPIIVVDLRMESHGFIGDDAVSWHCPMNWDRLNETNYEKLEADEAADFSKLRNNSASLVHVKGLNGLKDPDLVVFESAMTESEFFKKVGLQYLRIPIPDHRRPRTQEVDLLLTLFRSHSGWIHFHCAAGKGRTTTAMIMRDIFINANLISLEDILHRNAKHSLVDLRDLEFYRNTYKHPHAKDRLKFLGQFYEYCREKGTFMRWSEYAKNKNIQ